MNVSQINPNTNHYKTLATVATVTAVVLAITLIAAAILFIPPVAAALTLGSLPIFLIAGSGVGTLIFGAAAIALSLKANSRTTGVIYKDKSYDLIPNGEWQINHVAEIDKLIVDDTSLRFYKNENPIPIGSMIYSIEKFKINQFKKNALKITQMYPFNHELILVACLRAAIGLSLERSFDYLIIAAFREQQTILYKNGFRTSLDIPNASQKDLQLSNNLIKQDILEMYLKISP